MHKNWLLWALLGAAIAGIFCGWFFGHSMTAIDWVGELFLDALKMTIIPLIVCCRHQRHCLPGWNFRRTAAAGRVHRAVLFLYHRYRRHGGVDYR